MGVIIGKHAYLIIAHTEFDLLKLLLSLIDDERNDIFIHIDKKVDAFNETDITSVVEKSRIYFSDRINVTWGGRSQIESELKLLEIAVHGNYDYYHLLSGQDLPIKSQNYIHNFFEKNKGKEFVRFYSENFTHQERVKYYHFLIDKVGKKRTFVYKVLWAIEKISLKTQKILKINRIKNHDKQYQKGTNWFSITDDLAKYVVDSSEKILKEYKHTFCCDEIFLQTLVVNSPFVDNLYHPKFDNDIAAIMRLIDWERGKPYTFRTGDFDELIKSDMLFARKFSMNIDEDIVNKITKHVKNSDASITNNDSKSTNRKLTV